MTNTHYLANQLLIAMPALDDPIFAHTVSYLYQHTAEGALAIIINRPTGMVLANIFDQMGIESASPQIQQIPVFAGGPVQKERGFIIHDKDSSTWDATLSISDTTAMTSSRDILEAIAAGEGPKHFLIALGYAGWGAGQLEKEILSNSWLNTPYQQDILYDTPAKHRWITAANQLGVDINQLTAPAGHA